MMAHASPEITVDDLLQATRGAMIRGRRGETIRGVETDSRAVSQGNLFVALRGERFDGHDYLDQAVGKKAGGLLIDRDDGHDRGPVPTILVDNTLTALGDAAQSWRRRFTAPVLAVTGSSGKTTTKEMTAAILSQKKSILKTRGNYNNLIGLPLTLFSFEAHHDLAILELGTNRPGEIARLTQIAEPNIAVVTNVGPAHLEGFGSLEGVGKEKGDIFRYMPDGGTAIVNLDDEYTRRFETDKANRRITFGFRADADVSAANIRGGGVKGMTFTLQIETAKTDINLPVTGRHNITNALAAAASAWAAGASVDEIRQGLENFQPVAGRMEIISLRNGAIVVNDTYNANPASMAEGLRALQALRGQGRGAAILGDMLELGAEAEARHKDIGGLLADTGVHWVYLRGRLSRATAAGALHKGMAEEQITHFTEPAEILDLLSARMAAGDWILVKGSRGMKMEEVVDALVAMFGKKGEDVIPSQEKPL